MKTIVSLSIASVLCLARLHAESLPGQIDFGSFSPSKSGGEFVEIQLKGPLLSLAARVAGKEDPEVGRLFESLKSVHVNVVGLGEDNRSQVSERLTEIRGQLTKEGWERIVNVQEKGSQVSVHVKMRGSESVEGIVVMIEERGKQAVFINVVGDVKPEQLEKLGARLNLEPLKHAGQALNKEKK